MRKYIDLVIASAEEGVSKPDRRIFEIALERSGCKPENAVMIGDRIDNDIVPAKQLGMKTIWIKQGFGSLWTVMDESEKPILKLITYLTFELSIGGKVNVQGCYTTKRPINEQIDKNIETIIMAMEEASENHADILLLPECFITGYDLPMSYEKVLQMMI